jgi:hypothetical protein
VRGEAQAAEQEQQKQQNDQGDHRVPFRGFGPHCSRSPRDVSAVIRQMEQGASQILDAGPRERTARSPTILSMQSTSPIRRYVLLRHRGHDASASRWSMERVAPSSRGVAGRAPMSAQSVKPAAERG